MTDSIKKTNQIARFDGKNKFVEVLTHSFDIEKILLQFCTYDTSRESGNRMGDKVPIYLDFPKALVFAENILNGSLYKAIDFVAKYGPQANALDQVSKGHLENAKKMTTIAMAGTPARSLQAQNRPRHDGKDESRVLTIQQGNIGILLQASKGPGRSTKTGLIAPDGQPDTRVAIPMTKASLTELALVIKTHIAAYVTLRHMRGFYAYNMNEMDFGDNEQGGQQSAPAPNFGNSQPAPPPSAPAFGAATAPSFDAAPAFGSAPAPSFEQPNFNTSYEAAPPEPQPKPSAPAPGTWVPGGGEVYPELPHTNDPFASPGFPNPVAEATQALHSGVSDAPPFPF